LALPPDQAAAGHWKGRREALMKADVGDRIIVRGYRIDEPDRDCVVLETRGPDGEPPYLVRWDDDGHEGLFFPGSDAVVHHYASSGA
jgi:hypothetical protein